MAKVSEVERYCTMAVSVHLDTILEWRLLAALTDSKFYDYIYRVAPALFTLERVKIFDSIRQCHMVYGSVTPEGIANFYGKECPTELDVSVIQDIQPIIDRLHTIAVRRQLKEKARRLELIADGDTLTLDVVQQELEFQPIMQDEDPDIASGGQLLLANYKKKKDKTYTYISTGIPTLDSYMRGEWPIGFTILGALSGTGKTALSLQSMLEMARMGIPSMMINLEMEKDALVERMAANIAGIDGMDIAAAELTDEEEARLEEAVNYVNTLPIKMICNSDLDVAQIIGHIKEWASKGYKVFFVDHLQLIKSSNDNRNNALGDIAWALKIIANKLKIRVVVLTQLTKKDGGYEVRDSGEVRPKAETFFILTTDSDSDRRVVTVEFEKNRNGKLGSFPLVFEAKYQRFIDNYARQKATAAD